MIRLTRDKIAISPIYDPDTSPSGLIIIPDVAKEKCDQGIVKYIGPGVKYLKPGDYVLFGGYDGTNIKLQDEGILIIMSEKYIKCLIDPPDTEVPGLYFKGKDGNFFTATYEVAVDFISSMWTNHDVSKGLHAKHKVLDREKTDHIEEDNDDE